MPIDFTKIAFAKDTCPCSYYPEKKCTQLFNISEWFKEDDFNNLINLDEIKKTDEKEDFSIKHYYNYLKQNGFCRYNKVFYKYICEDCKECQPIRIRVNEFKPTKNQRASLAKNWDVEIKLVKDSTQFISEEKALLFREYDEYHNGKNKDFQKKTLQEAINSLTEMTSGYEGIWNLEYRLNGRLIGVSILDYTEDSSGNIVSLCSNYFYYEVSKEILKRSLGVFSVLKEIELCKQLGIKFYYLGLYLPNCFKMNYKTNYEPNELLIENLWVNSNFQLPGPGSVSEDYEDICFVTDEIELPVLVAGYRNGIFPWFNEVDGNPVLWQSPNPRFVIDMEELHIPKTLKKFLKHTPYTYTMDKCFDEVIKQCSLMERKGQNGTWIGPKMLEAYHGLYELGYAHSFEVWHDEKLVGGFYGELFGALFCGESMFTIESNSSSSAFVLFAQKFRECGGKMIDCQAYTDNMARYGAKEISREEYLKKAKKYQRIRIKGFSKESGK